MKSLSLPPSRRSRQPLAVARGAQPIAAQIFGGRPEHVLALLRAAWPAAVGPELARRTEVVALDGRMLRVRVPDARWQRVIHRLQRPILQRLWLATGDLAPKSLGFHQGALTAPPWPESAWATRHAEQAAPPPAVVPPSIREAAKTIDDLDLRERFTQTAARYLQRQRGEG
jgi:Dna[CI] antecedent, DciA